MTAVQLQGRGVTVWEEGRLAWAAGWVLPCFGAARKLGPGITAAVGIMHFTCGPPMLGVLMTVPAAAEPATEAAARQMTCQAQVHGLEAYPRQAAQPESRRNLSPASMAVRCGMQVRVDTVWKKMQQKASRKFN